MKSKCKFIIIAAPPIITALLILSLFAAFGIFPFGSKTIAWCDLDQQTIPLIMELKDILNGKGSIFFSTANGGGMNFWGVFLFFLASPFYLLTAFVQKEDMIYFINILFILKLCTASLTAGLYFQKSYTKLYPAISVLLSVMYSMCGYGLMYYQSLMWLDVMYLFPLLLLSVDKMCRNGNPVMYCIMLSLTVTVNYYLSYMTVIYLIFYVTLYIIIVCRKEKRKKVSAAFLLSSAAAAFITAPVWLCSYIQILSSARGMNSFLKFISSPFSESLSEKLCLLMCTAFVFAVLPFVFILRLYRKKRIKHKLAVLIILLIPVFIDPVNKLWHTGNYQSFPMRFGYITVFTLLTLAADLIGGMRKKERDGRRGMIYTVSMLLLTALSSFLYFTVLRSNQNKLSGYFNSLMTEGAQFQILCGLFISIAALYFIAIMLFKIKGMGVKSFTVSTALIFIVEFVVNSTVYVGFAANNGTVFKNTMKAESVAKTESFYRTKAEKKYIHANMTGALGYNSLAHYTSLTPEDYMFAMKKMGYSSYWMEVSPNGGTVLTDAVLAVKYSIGTTYEFASYQKNLGENSIYTVAESSMVLPGGIIINSSPSEICQLEMTDRAAVQEQIAEKLLGSDDIVKRYGYEVICGSISYDNNEYSIIPDERQKICIAKYSAEVKGRQQLYFDLFGNLSNDLKEKQYYSAEVYVNGKRIIENYPNQRSNGFLNLGEFCDETAEITVIINKRISVSSFGVFGIDTDELADSIAETNTAEPIVDGNKITVNCKADKESLLYLSVPWDKGFSAELNGEKTSIYRVNDAFCAIKLKKGTNKIEMVYYPPCFKFSLVLSVMGLLFLIYLSFTRRPYPPLICKISYITIIGALSAAFSIMYIAAPVLCLIGKII